MNGLIFSNDKLGLTGISYDVPETEEMPANYGLTSEEIEKNRKLDADIYI
jgi:hypothetical protein